jgi:MFS family permease
MGLLLGVMMLNFLDRQVINILAEPIRNELGLADWQLGVMSGLAFALLYTVLGIPIARLAERRSRPVIMGVCIAVWSTFTVLCGTAQNFLQLVLCRVGVGVGEAGCVPLGHSLISDSVPKERRASALAFFSMGSALGGLLGMVMGGLVADAYGWRVAFFVAGAPGVLFAILALTTLREPRHQLSEELRRATLANQATFGDTLRLLRTKPTFWLVAFGAASKAFIAYGHAPFTASFFLRVHKDEVADIAANFGLQSVGFMGIAIGLIAGIGGAISSFAGGKIADRYQQRDRRTYVTLPAVASFLVIPLFVTALSVESAPLGLAFLFANALCTGLWYGPVFATVQSVVPPHMRSTGSALLMFIQNLVGLGLGPLAVGLLSDTLANGLGLGSAQGVRWALIGSASVGLIACALFWRARSTIERDLES